MIANYCSSTAIVGVPDSNAAETDALSGTLNSEVPISGVHSDVKNNELNIDKGDLLADLGCSAEISRTNVFHKLYLLGM